MASDNAKRLAETHYRSYEQHKELSGYHAAKWMVEQGYKPTLAIVHSMNIVGARNIHQVLTDAGVRSVVRVFTPHEPLILHGVTR